MDFSTFWGEQEKQNRKYWLPKDFRDLTKEEIDTRTIKHIAAIIDNAMKMLNETDWKLHLKNYRNTVDGNFVLHGVDVFKQLVSLLQLRGVDVNEFIDAVKRKNALIEMKKGFKDQEPIDHRRKAVCIDIDGVVVNYREAIADFIRLHTIYRVPEEFKHYHIWKDIPNMTYEVYEDLYRKFVEDGGYKDINDNDDADVFVDYFRKKYTIVFVTSRPIHKYAIIEADTYEWLREIGYENIIVKFGKDKAEILESLWPIEVAFYVEDVPKHAVETAQAGFRTYLINKSYNIDMKVKNRLITRVNSLMEIVDTYEVNSSGG